MEYFAYFISFRHFEHLINYYYYYSPQNFAILFYLYLSIPTNLIAFRFKAIDFEETPKYLVVTPITANLTTAYYYFNSIRTCEIMACLTPHSLIIIITHSPKFIKFHLIFLT